MSFAARGLRRLVSSLGIGAVLAGSAGAAEEATLLLRDGERIHPPAPTIPEGFMYWSTSDTTLRPDKPFADYGASYELTLRPGADRVLLRFEHLLTAMGGPYQDLTEATLTLTLVDPPDDLPDPADIRVYEVQSSWNEGGRADSENYWAATWRARYHARTDKLIAWQGAGCSEPRDATLLEQAQVSFEPATVKRYTLAGKDDRETAQDAEVMTMRITGLEPSIERYLRRRYENHGWLVVWHGPEESDRSLRFHSREAVRAERECRPALQLEYAPVDRPDYQYDLGVAYITRFPEYFAWIDTGRDGEHGGYERKPFRGQPGSGILKRPAYADTPKNPQPGDTVWYVARIKNHGPQVLKGGVKIEWRLNDKVIRTDERPQDLAPGFEIEDYVALPFPENLNDHRDEFLTLHVEPLSADAGAENKHNNVRTIFTKGRATGVVADETARAWYTENDNAYGTQSFEDWIQFQIDYWNEVYMAKSRFRDGFPDGSLARIRVQRVEFVRDGILAGGVHIPFDLRQPKYDGMWGWDFTSLRADPSLADKPDWFHRLTLKMVEPSLIHEMSHQCFGLVDIYWMTMEPAKDPETGEGGKVRIKDVEQPGQYLVGVGYWPPAGGLMGGGDTRYTPQHEPTGLYSSHSVGGLNTNAPYRGGFFGDYLYDVPDDVTLAVKTADGRPAAGAEIKIWQSNYGWDPPKHPIDDSKSDVDVYFEGTLDEHGRLDLPDQETGEPEPFTTLTGHTLRPNIFGRIHVVAFNGNMLVRVKWQGEYYYHMMLLWEYNLAYWRGHTNHYDYEFSLTEDKLPGEGFDVTRHPIID